jgi:hypothetical protein
MATDGRRAARTTPGPLIRVIRAWRALSREQRLTAVAALALWLTMFLPWYSENGLAKNSAVSLSLTAWDAFSFVELAVLAVSVAVLALLFARGERRAFHLPGGDGGVIMVAGAWVAVLIFYRILDKPSARDVITGIQWGIFIALFAAIWLAYTGVAMRRAHRAEPTLADDPTVHLRASRPQRGVREQARRRDEQRPAGVGLSRPPRRREADLVGERDPGPAGEPSHEHRGVTREDAEQLSFELPHDPEDR